VKIKQNINFFVCKSPGRRWKVWVRVGRKITVKWVIEEYVEKM
jgi:hypothetical protein